MNTGTEKAKEIARARVLLKFANGDLHDKAHDIWCSIRDADVTADRNADYYDCALCGATMFECMDYTHKSDCPYEVFGRAIDAFTQAIEDAGESS